MWCYRTNSQKNFRCCTAVAHVHLHVVHFTCALDSHGKLGMAKDHSTLRIPAGLTVNHLVLRRHGNEPRRRSTGAVCRMRKVVPRATRVAMARNVGQQHVLAAFTYFPRRSKMSASRPAADRRRPQDADQAIRTHTSSAIVQQQRHSRAGFVQSSAGKPHPTK